MKKLINGIIEFRKNVLDGYKERFAQLALLQKPDSLFIACSDSRVVPNLFASTNPGDLFVVRNIGNLVPSSCYSNFSQHENSVAAAIEFALSVLQVTNIIVCGHSQCGAVRAIMDGKDNLNLPHLQRWLVYGEPMVANTDLQEKLEHDAALDSYNHASQLNVLLQLEHLKTYPLVQKKMAEGSLFLHGWWFDIAKADVYAYEEDFKRFVLIDEVEADRILEKLG